MFGTNNIVRFISILSYIGFIITSINCFVVAKKPLNPPIITSSIVVLISSVFLIIADIYNNYIFIDKYIYYIRGSVLLHYSILVLGLYNVGIGFGIMGIIVSLINVLAGLFDIDESKYTSQTLNDDYSNLDTLQRRDHIETQENSSNINKI